MANMTQGLNLAASRGRQGEREFYQVTVKNSVLNNFFTVNMDPPAEKSQRQLDPKHAQEIAEYILDNPDEYLLGTVVYAVDRDCPFQPSEISPDLGMLTIPFGTNLRSLDGQHRREGLNRAISEDAAIADDDTAVLIYVEPDVTKRRQMFSDMNATPKVVAKALNVAFDSRDPFARAAQALAAHPFIAGVIEMDAARIRPNGDKWFSLGAIHDALKRLQVGPNGRVRNASQYAEQAISERGAAFLELLNQSRPEFGAVRSGAEDLEAMRSRSILFSSTTMRAIAGAVWIAMQANPSADIVRDFAPKLATIDFEPTAPIWQQTGFVSPGKATPNARNQEVSAATRAIADVLKS